MPPEDPEQARWFQENLQPHRDSLKAWLQGRFQEHADLDDIIQESVLRVLRMREEGEIRSPKALLYTTARNLALDNAKNFRVSRTDPLGENEDWIVSDDAMLANNQAVRNEELEIMTRAIQSLPTRCRQIFTLRKVYGMRQKEVARELGISEKTVAAQIAIGMSKCTSYVARYYQGRGGNR